MAPPEHRRWMDNRVVGQNSRISNEFFVGVEEFLEFASHLDEFKDKGKCACPCLECKCERLLEPDEVRTHLYEKGFMADYYHWLNHGEKEKHPHELAPDEQKAMDMAGASKDPCPISAEFNDLLATAQAPLYDGGDKTVLSTALELLRFQSDNDISDVFLDETIIDK